MRHLVPGLVVHSKFELTREIGKGGMGAVWEAHDRSLRRNVAIEFILAT